jgi:hypothetical protein
MALNDIVDEIKGRQKMAPVQAEKPCAKKEAGKKKSMTKEELEAYRQKKMAEEEAKYLKMAKKDAAAKPDKSAKPAKPAKKAEKPEATEKPQRQPRQQKPRQPKMLQPLEPLYLLKIPGLPKGDCIAICLAHGAE